AAAAQPRQQCRVAVAPRYAYLSFRAGSACHPTQLRRSALRSLRQFDAGSSGLRHLQQHAEHFSGLGVAGQTQFIDCAVVSASVLPVTDRLHVLPPTIPAALVTKILEQISDESD